MTSADLASSGAIRRRVANSSAGWRTVRREAVTANAQLPLPGIAYMRRPRDHDMRIPATCHNIVHLPYPRLTQRPPIPAAPRLLHTRQNPHRHRSGCDGISRPKRRAVEDAGHARGLPDHARFVIVCGGFKSMAWRVRRTMRVSDISTSWSSPDLQSISARPASTIRQEQRKDGLMRASATYLAEPIACIAVLYLAATPAAAQDVAFDIPAGRLSDALVSLGRASGYHHRSQRHELWRPCGPGKCADG